MAQSRRTMPLDRGPGERVQLDQEVPAGPAWIGQVLFRPEPIRTISVVFGINSQIRIRFSSLRIFFLNDSIFWCVQSSTTNNVTVHVHVLWPVLNPQNSISNVVSMTIHYVTHIYTHTFLTYVNVHGYVYVRFLSMYMSMFRDLESGLSKVLKDGERGLRRANAGGDSWRY